MFRDLKGNACIKPLVMTGTGGGVHQVGKTNAVRMLDGLGIKYELRQYEVDPDDLSAETVAAKVGLPAEKVFKTLAVQGDRNGVSLAVIPGDKELDFKALARETGDRKVDLIPLKEVQAVTGYIRGGVTALACKKDYPVYIDKLAEGCDVISISAGMRGMQILLAPRDYTRAVNAKVAAIAKAKNVQ
jgi:Cys-tRNA(Pro)/Cys-tRNA(Cys) deacylase